MLTPQGLVVSNIEDEINSAYKLNVDAIKVTVDLQSAFQKMLCLRAALEKTMINYISLES